MDQKDKEVEIFEKIEKIEAKKWQDEKQYIEISSDSQPEKVKPQKTKRIHKELNTFRKQQYQEKELAGQKKTEIKINEKKEQNKSSEEHNKSKEQNIEEICNFDFSHNKENFYILKVEKCQYCQSLEFIDFIENRCKHCSKMCKKDEVYKVQKNYRNQVNNLLIIKMIPKILRVQKSQDNVTGLKIDFVKSGNYKNSNFLTYKQSRSINKYINRLRWALICIGNALIWLNKNNIIYNNVLDRIEIQRYKAAYQIFYRLYCRFQKNYPAKNDSRNGLMVFLEKQFQELKQNIVNRRQEQQESRREFQQKSKNLHSHNEEDYYIGRCLKNLKKKIIINLLSSGNLSNSDILNEYLQYMKIIYSNKDVLHYGLFILRLTCPQSHVDIEDKILSSYESNDYDHDKFVSDLIQKAKYNPTKINFFVQTSTDSGSNKLFKQQTRLSCDNIMEDVDQSMKDENMNEDSQSDTQQSYDYDTKTFKFYLKKLMIQCTNPWIYMSSDHLKKELDKIWNVKYTEAEETQYQ